MPRITSPPLSLRARGPLAVFSAAEFKVERVSTPVMTPSAARGLLESVLWKPAIRWRVERIRVLAPIRFLAFRRNEVNRKAVAPGMAVMRDGGTLAPYFADDDRTQRNTIALRDVDYVIEARFTMTDRAGPSDNVAKFVDMFRRRVERGQYFQQPYLGCREFAAEVMPADDAPLPIAEDRDLGLMLWDIAFSADGNRPIFFPAELRQGVLHVPDMSVELQGMSIGVGAGGGA